MKVDIKIYFDNQYLEFKDTDYDEFHDFLKDDTRNIHSFSQMNGRKIFVFKDKISFAEVQEKTGVSHE